MTKLAEDLAVYAREIMRLERKVAELEAENIRLRRRVIELEDYEAPVNLENMNIKALRREAK